MFISRPFKPRCDCDDSDEWRISFSRRISSAPRANSWAWPWPSMRLSYFDQLFNSLNIGAGSTLTIINDDGILLAQKPRLVKDSIGKSFANRPNCPAHPARRQRQLRQHVERRPVSNACTPFPGSATCR